MIRPGRNSAPPKRARQSDPIRMMFRDPRVSAEKLEEMKQTFGLDKPLSGQFVAYVKSLARADLGLSFSHRRPVLEVIASQPVSWLFSRAASIKYALVLP